MSSRFKGMLFNTLNHAFPLGFQCVTDCFAGSGALGLETLSRGLARHAYFIDSSPLCSHCIDQNIRALHLQSQTHVFLGDFFKAPASFFMSSDLFILSPPYQKNLVMPSLTFLLNLLDHPAVFVVDFDCEESFSLPSSCHLLQEKSSGRMRLLFLSS